MADRQPESAIAISFAIVFPCQLRAHFGLSTDVLYKCISFAKQQSKRERLQTRLRYNLISGYQHDCIMADTFFIYKNDYSIPWFIKSNRPLSFLYAISISNLMYQFKTYTTELKT